MAKAPSKSAKTHPASAAPRGTVHLKQEELRRVDELRVNIVKKSKTQAKPDIESTLELMYLRVLSRVKNRGSMEKELKDLKSLLDKAGAKMTEILDKADSPTASK